MDCYYDCYDYPPSSRTICQERCHNEIWKEYDDCGDLIPNEFVLEYSVSVIAYYRPIPLHPKKNSQKIIVKKEILKNTPLFDPKTGELLEWGDLIPNSGIINTTLDFPTEFINIYQTNNVCFEVIVKTKSVRDGFVWTCEESTFFCNIIG